MDLNNTLASVETRIADLERRLADAESSVAHLKQQLERLGYSGEQDIPFRLLDSEGNRLLEVSDQRNDRSIAMFNRAGTEVMNIGCDGTHAGFLALRNAAGELLFYVTLETAGAKAEINSTGGRSFIMLFGNEDTGPGITVASPGDGYGVTINGDEGGGRVEVFSSEYPEPLSIIGVDESGGVVEVRTILGRPTRLRARVFAVRFVSQTAASGFDSAGNPTDYQSSMANLTFDAEKPLDRNPPIGQSDVHRSLRP